jgi:hypothetical protein
MSLGAVVITRIIAALNQIIYPFLRQPATDNFLFNIVGIMKDSKKQPERLLLLAVHKC